MEETEKSIEIRSTEEMQGLESNSTADIDCKDVVDQYMDLDQLA